MSEPFPSLSLVPKARDKQTAKDFKTDQEVRWCPGCGDYGILNSLQVAFASLNARRSTRGVPPAASCPTR